MLFLCSISSYLSDDTVRHAVVCEDYVCMCACVCVRTRAYIRAYIQLRVCKCVCVCVCVCHSAATGATIPAVEFA